MDRSSATGVLFAGAAGLATYRLVLRRRSDPVVAPGHRHRGPAPEVAAPTQPKTQPKRDQPWVRRSHSDSQQRRFRR
jgi:hypothetical protein